ncbi:MAG: HEAT repeat domain-containing protein [Planctomycetaceae bacterium]|nr:hypothetical protein [Planctomycetaceae bacterium]
MLKRPWFWIVSALVIAAVAAAFSMSRESDDIEQMRRAQDISGLARVIAAGNETDACRAIKALSAMGKHEAVAPIVSATADPRQVIRQHAVLAVARAAPRKYGTLLTDKLLNDESADVRAVAARAIGESWDFKRMPELITAMEKDSNEEVFRQAQRSAARICGMEPGYESATDLATRRARAVKFYDRCWKVYGDILKRYHGDYLGRDDKKQ